MSRPLAPLGTVDHLGVIVPVRDEQELLPKCLQALAEAVEAVTRSGLVVQVVLVLDGCTDASDVIARTAPWSPRCPRPQLVETPTRGVGAARATGAAHVVQGAAVAGVSPERTWLANTDADSTVPRSWLCAQIEAAAAGWDAWVGTVKLAAANAPGSAREQLAARWTQAQNHHEGHRHVHGANLGVRASAYLGAGGFAAKLSGEDQSLVAALAAGGASVLRTARHPVVTSDRVAGRAPGGVSAYLSALALQSVAASASGAADCGI